MVLVAFDGATIRPACGTEPIGVTSRTIPSVADRPATEWPPLRIAVGRRSPRATARVAATSAGVAHRTTAAGRKSSKRAITGLRTDS
jgi:hypothetical protein